MRTVYLGQTGIEVSELCFGTMSFAREADEATSAQLFARCRDAGINFFDCANMYSAGRSEEILGKLMAGARDELVITSKVAMHLGDGPNQGGLSPRHIRRQIELSLRRLGTDYLDIYFCHHHDEHTPAEQTLRTLNDLVREGKVRHVGVSNWEAWRIALGMGKAEALGLAPIDVLQPMYSLAKRTAEVEILPLAKHSRLGVIPYSPLGGGLLTGKYTVEKRDQTGRLTTSANYAQRYADAGLYEIAERFCAHTAEFGMAPATLAVAWVKANPAVTAPIIGARNLDQLEPSLAAADVDLTAEQWEAISALTPPVPIPTDRDEERGRGVQKFL